MRKLIALGVTFLLIGCSSENSTVSTPTDTRMINILALGDSYTKGESVCSTCNFPSQLRDSINGRRKNTLTTARIIAQTGWTTYNLKNGINQANVPNDYDLVTLLIGVNNQYQNQPFSLYQTEFPELVQTAIQKAKGDKSKVIVVSIPDYAFTPYGGGNPAITNGLLPYNQFAADYCAQQQITFVNITDITQLGLQQPNLVASDGLHPSTLAYTKFVERILPVALQKLGLPN
ncbi:SGNH/GDSL hydrolase family protein [Flavobacterium stagni]|uniref:SGNH/GDSL hydrolase family protein n=1 Tax=Flavobacterium stagni TaxID=2506421 RepID=A0A4Q1KD60_9FLAO|nr:SGNH/GDSL hydrolase family protein [Flavobacterium stagni]RXR24631.1 SGNH/GDSL hydrolase family protein [Flavobacterium stagni]